VLSDALRLGELDREDARWLHPAFVKAVVRRLLELAGCVAPSLPVALGLLTANELTERLHVKPTSVYANQRRPGAIRLGDGPKARLRFDASAVEAELHRPLEDRDPSRGDDLP
jgi:hypothetical protein